MRTVLRILCAALACALLASAQAASFSDVQRAVVEGRWADAEQRAEELDTAAGRGDFLALYVKSAQLMQQKRCSEAIPLARILLQLRPDFVPAQELIFLCNLRAGNQEAARTELAALLTILPEGPQRDAVEEMLARMRAKDGPQFSAYFEARPSTNILRQTDETEIPGLGGAWSVADDARAKSGIEYEAGVSVRQQLFSTHGMNIGGVLRADISWDTVRERLYPELTAEMPVSFNTLGIMALTVTPFMTLGLNETDYRFTRLGTRGVASMPLSDTLTLGWSGIMHHSEYVSEEAWRNAWQFQNTFALSSLLNKQTRVTGSLGLDNYLPDDTNRGFHAVWASLRLDHMMDNGLIVGLQGRVGQRHYEAPPAYRFDGGDDQRDTFYSAQLELSHRDLVLGPIFDNTVRPVLFYEYTDQASNNVFYDYESHDVGLSLRMAF